MTPEQQLQSDRKTLELLSALSTRIDLLVQSVDVLGALVKLQGERITALEDRLTKPQDRPWHISELQDEPEF